MAHPMRHAESCSRKWGGKPEEYLPIHEFFDSSKESFPDNRHRALLHSSFGIFLAEKIFGHEITLSTGRTVPVRYIGELHVTEDLGYIPTAADYLQEMEPKPWMSGIGCPPSAARLAAAREKKVKIGAAGD